MILHSLLVTSGLAIPGPSRTLQHMLSNLYAKWQSLHRDILFIVSELAKNFASYSRSFSFLTETVLRTFDIGNFM